MTDLPEAVVQELASQYEFERELGRGGMAVVYLARDIRHGRHVAIKVMRDDLTTAVGSERFLREISIAARLTHPNILALYNSGVAAGMLYYVMPYIAGETLRDRLDRERQLPIGEALALGRQIAAAIDYAHAQGVVHRDIKPENVLLQGDHAIVADFGLARALYTAASAAVTQSGMAVGTPAYMSPEQATGDRLIDGRTDVYSLACVIFEMIAGVPPFRAATLQALLAQHATREPPSVCADRMSCPPSVDAGLRRGLAKLPADRFRTAAELMQAIEAPTQLPEVHAVATPRGRSVRSVAFAVGAVALVAVIAAVATRGTLWAKPLDESRYAVLPFSVGESGPASSTQSAAVQEGVTAALTEWRGVEVVDKRRLREAIEERAKNSELRLANALKVARDVRAKNLIWGEISSSSDSIRVSATLYDAQTGAERRSHVVMAGENGAIPRQIFRVLASRLLREGAELPWRSDADAQAASLSAWQAYDSAQAALEKWNLRAARTSLQRAIQIDPRHARAQLWLARTDMWSGAPADQWVATVRRAVDLRTQLGTSDSLAALALLDLGEGRYPESCERYRAMIADDSSAFSAHFGLGQCQLVDDIVVPDSRSPSAFRFRSSHHRAAESFIKAIQVARPRAPAFVYNRLGRVLHTQTNRFRPGRAQRPRTELFGAYPSLSGDTLAYIPFPIAKFSAGNADIPSTLLGAIERNRAILRPVYAAWVEEAPDSADAHVALGHLLESTQELTGPTGQRSALSEVRIARTLMADTAKLLALAVDEARLLLKTRDWTRAATIADSLIAAHPRPGDAAADALVSLTALTGRVRQTADLLDALSGLTKYQVTSRGEPITLPPAIQREASRALAYATVGACGEMLNSLPDRITDMLESHYTDADQRASIRSAVLRRPLRLGLPCMEKRGIGTVNANGDRLIEMQQALARGDLAAVRAHFDTTQRARRHRPGDVAIEYTYLESWTLAAAGDTLAAVRHLDRSLRDLSTLGSYLLGSPSQSAGLVRAMGLRAELANWQGDLATARKWANAVATLWRTADDELQPYVGRMKALSAG